MDSTMHLVARQEVEPTLPPPRGVTSNFVDPESRAQEVVVCTAIFLALAATFVGMRLITRGFINRALGWDDFVCTLALALSIPYAVWVIDTTRYGLGRHMWDVPKTTYKPAYRYHFYIIDALYAVLIFTAKLAILLLYFRIFQVSKAMKWAIHSVIFVLAIQCLVTLFASIFRCKPRTKAWDPAITHGRCANALTGATALAVLNAVVDFAILVLPMPLIKKLNLPWKKKLAVLSVFMTGAFVCAVSVYRVVVFIRTFKTVDLTWNQVRTLNWSTVEVYVCIICSCMPCIPSLMRTVRPKILSLTGYGSRSGTGPSGSKPSKLSWSRSKSRKTESWADKSGDQTSKDLRSKSSTYLELGEGGVHQATVGSRQTEGDSEIELGNGIIKTVGVEVAAQQRT